MRLGGKETSIFYFIYFGVFFFFFLSNDHVIHIMNILNYVCEQTLYENIKINRIVLGEQKCKASLLCVFRVSY